MASGTFPPFVPPADGQGHADPYEVLIDQRLQKTRRQVKGVEISAALIGMIAAALAYLLLAAVADQWLIPGGLGFWGRSLLFLVLAAGLGYYFLWQRLVPLVLRRINPIFAAHVIEQSRPSLKNSLINFLFLRRDREEAIRDDLQRRVYFGLERTTAAEMAQVEVEAVVDHVQVIRLGYLLAGVLLVACLYLLISPKNPLVSFSRVILPWADIRPPTRVTIDEVTPGDTVAYQGDQLAVSAEVHGLRADEPVTLYFSTADHQSVDQAVAMTLPEGSYRHGGKLPPGDLELQQDLSYYLVAGDCKTRPFHVKVETALSIDVARVDYRYPVYTGLAPKTVRGLADLRAIEGTRVTLHATANQEIQQASVELGNDHRTWLKMKAQGKSAVVDLQLLLKPDDPTQPQYDSYQVRFTDALNRENPRPIRHPIEVFRDAPPAITLVDPPADKIQIPANSTLALQVLAEDPDFGLRRVAVQVRKGQEPPKTGTLLNLDWKKEKPLLGPFKKSCPITPARLGFKPGDTLTYWAEADDCREAEDPAGARTWKPNHVETPRRTILVVAGSGPQHQQGDHGEKQPGASPQHPEAGQGEASNGNDQGKPDTARPNGPGQPQESDTQLGQPPPDRPDAPHGSAASQPKGNPDQTQKPQDKSPDHGDQGNSAKPSADNAAKPDESPQEKANESDPGDVMDKVLENQKEQEKQQPKEQQSGQQQSGQQQSGQQQSGQQQSGQQQSGQQQSGQQQSGQQQSGQQQSGQQQSGQPQSGQQQSGQQQSGQQQSGEQQSGQQQSGQQQSGQQQSGQQQSGQPQSGQQQSGQPQSGQQQSGQPQSGQQQSGQPQSGQQQSGQQQSGQPQSGQQQSGQPQSGQQQSGQPQSGQQQSGQPQSGQQQSGQPQSGQQQSGQPQSGQQQSGQPQSGQQQSGQPQSGQQQSGQPQSGQQQSGQPQSGQQQSGQPQSGQQQSGQPQSGQQQSGQPQSGQQQSGQPQSGQQQSGQPQSGQPQSGQPQSGQPQSGQPQSGQPQSGQPQSGQPQSGQPQSGQPQSGQPQSGQPQSGQPQAGQPQSGQPQSGQPQSGQPQSGQPQSGQPQSGQPQSGQPQSGQPQSGQPQSGQPQSGQPQAGQESQPGQQPSPSKSASSGGTKNGSQKLPDNQPPTSRDTAPGQKAGVGEGSEAQDTGPKQSMPAAKTDAPGQEPKAHGGEQSQGENQPGHGGSSGKEVGGTSPQGDNAPHAKTPGLPEENNRKSGQDDAASSPSGSPKKSDSRSQENGDRSGGGGTGGGQQANQAGTDTPGSHSSAKQGAGKSEDQGEGEIGHKGGDQVRSDHPTGHAASQGEGPGSTSHSKPGGQESGQQTQQQQQPRASQPSTSGGKGSSQPSGGGDSSNPKPGTAGTTSAGNPVAGGSGSDEARGPAPPPPNAAPSGDAANLDFASKQTDLALDYLARQLAKDKPDPRLLGSLGWTRADLEKFYQQWAQMRREAQVAGPEAKKQYNDALRSLGLKPHSTELRGGDTPRDKYQHLRDSRRSDPPPGWRDLFDAYSEGIAGKK